jgi:hypothetical protein
LALLPPSEGDYQTTHTLDVRFVPKADSCTAAIWSLFDRFVGGGKQRTRSNWRMAVNAMDNEATRDTHIKKCGD